MYSLAASSLSKTTIGLSTNNLLEDRRMETSVARIEGSRFIYHQTLWQNIVPWHHKYPTSNPRFVPGGGAHLPSASSGPLSFSSLPSSLFFTLSFSIQGVPWVRELVPPSPMLDRPLSVSELLP